MSAGLTEVLSVVLLLARDAGRTAAFYQDVLGLPLRGEQHDGRHEHYACQLGTVQPDVDLGAPDEPRLWVARMNGQVLRHALVFVCRTSVHAGGRALGPVAPDRNRASRQRGELAEI